MPDILLVEDKDSLRRVLRLTLEAAGYTVTEAADALSKCVCWWQNYVMRVCPVARLQQRLI